jgi:hypothetical protein
MISMPRAVNAGQQTRRQAQQSPERDCDRDCSERSACCRPDDFVRTLESDESSLGWDATDEGDGGSDKVTRSQLRHRPGQLAGCSQLAQTLVDDRRHPRMQDGAPRVGRGPRLELVLTGSGLFREARAQAAGTASVDTGRRVPMAKREATPTIDVTVPKRLKVDLVAAAEPLTPATATTATARSPADAEEPFVDRLTRLYCRAMARMSSASDEQLAMARECMRGLLARDATQLDALICRAALAHLAGDCARGADLALVALKAADWRDADALHLLQECQKRRYGSSVIKAAVRRSVSDHG